MEPLTHSDHIVVDRSPEDLYALVSDITNMGEWSPICKQCWWDEGDGPRVGAWFTGRNELPERTWETRSEVVAADPGREFAFIVNGNLARWGYTFDAVDGGTEITESWEFLATGRPQFEQWFGDQTDAQIADRLEKAKSGIPETLAAIKRTAESQPAPRSGTQPAS
jgi:Polyketide cyclase / dehydrase and lipid transport